MQSLVFTILISVWKFSTAEDQDFFIPIQPCQSEEQRGNWCAWSVWSECRASTCTRTRTRSCACPTPSKWGRGFDCGDSRPQDDYLEEGAPKKHTRYIRKANGNVCQIPVIWNGQYHGDCFDDGGKKKCLVGKGLQECDVDAGELAIYGMVERDVGACDGWGTNRNRRTVTEIGNRFSYGAESDIGRRCSFDRTDILPLCVRNYFYGTQSYSDYGRISNLAFDIDNCRFACAIRKMCQGIEFAEGISCTLIMGAVTFAEGSYIGVVVETRSEQCSVTYEGGPYPYAQAISYLESKYGS
ncbi:unnamed protein product [Calicophoron daubneyi]|uniref:Uncharacterized protein n=1 Tax=Calicophoron daubneyi TaxID=300641 RepID=A0AAV2T1X8_CALDB